MTDTATEERPRILVVEDDPAYADRLRRNLGARNMDADVAPDVADAERRLAEARFDLVLTDIRLPGDSGLDLLERVVADADAPPVIVLTSVNSVDVAVDAMRKGAADYLTKEATRDEIVMRLRHALGHAELAGENRMLRRSLERYEEFDEIVGRSDAIARVKQQIAEVGPSEVSTLILGATGVGKELVARALHRVSPRVRGPFVEVNCAALPDENMFLSDLFGHERGSFTGAVGRKRGHFEMAHGGTLFFDEVGELGAIAQARLLRVVETLTFKRLGGEREIQANCRLVFATNRDLAREVKEGRFREDLFYRINVYPIDVPPLRARPEDVAPLARFFATRFSEKHHLPAVTFADDALERLRGNPWPGNVRELRNVIERLSIRFGGRAVDAADLHELDLAGGAASGDDVAILPEEGVVLENVERSLVEQALRRVDWNQRAAARLLGISVDRMNARVKKFGFSHPSWRVHKG